MPDAEPLRLSDLAAREPIPLGAVLTSEYLFDFMIMYHSLLETWSFYRFTLHTFVYEPELAERLTALDLPGVVVKYDSERPQSWRETLRARTTLVERSGLERCVVIDVDMLFVAETPELYFLLDTNDLVFPGGPAPAFPIPLGLWAFRRNGRSLAFARDWNRYSEDRLLADVAGLAQTMLEHESDVQVRVLAREPAEGSRHCRSPYLFNLHLRRLQVERDAFGFREPELGRAKVLHYALLRAAGSESVAARMDALAARFGHAAAMFPLYAELANRAAASLGMETVDDPAACAADALARRADSADSAPRKRGARRLSEKRLDDVFKDRERRLRYRQLAHHELADNTPIPIVTVVTDEQLGDVATLHRSLAESWSFYRFELHVCAREREVAEKLRSLHLPDTSIHLLEDGALPVERGIATRADNVFLTETPELYFLLDRQDLIEAGPGLWAYRRTPLTEQALGRLITQMVEPSGPVDGPVYGSRVASARRLPGDVARALGIA